MRYLALLLIFLSATTVFGQLDQLNLTNALVIGQLDKPEDRFSIEINLTELLTSNGVKAIPSLNVLKLGSDPELLATDSMQTIMTAKGIDTYVLVFVRGYDKKFKPTMLKDDFLTVLNTGSLFPIYREEVTSVSFEFLFYRNGAMVASDIVKCGSVSSRDAVVKKLRKGVEKRIIKKWK
jgi:hypothetical protein